MNRNNIRRELASACHQAVAEWLRSTRGAAAFGAGGSASVIRAFTVAVDGHVRGEAMPSRFEIHVKDGRGVWPSD